MRRIFRIFFGFIAAMVDGGATQEKFAQQPTEFAALDQAARVELIAEMGALALRAATHSAIYCAIFAPIVILFGELRRVRSWAYYTLTGIVISFSGLLAEYSSERAAEPTIINTYAMIAFIATGAIGGFVYWMVAGRNAGRRRPAARIRVAGGPDAGTWEEDEADHPGRVQAPAEKRQNGSQERTAEPVKADPVNPEPAKVEISGGDKQPAAQTKTSVPTTGGKSVQRMSQALAGSVPDSGAPKIRKD